MLPVYRYIVLGGSLLILLLGSSNAVEAAEPSTIMTAGVIAEKMNEGDLYTYVAGVVEGLAQARYRVDGKRTDGMSCIYGWFYDGDRTFERIFVTFAHFKDEMPGNVVAAMAEKRCPP